MNVSLIVSIVRKGWGNAVLEASTTAGANGGTLLLGRGTGIHEKQKILGILIEPEKEILLTIVRSEIVDVVLKAIVAAGELEKPGAGTAFVMPIQNVIGAIHLKQVSPDESG